MRSTILLALGLYESRPGCDADVFRRSTISTSMIPLPAALAPFSFDHAAIFVMIAGTFTPFALLCVRGVRGWKMFASIWAMAAVGIILKLTVPGAIRNPLDPRISRVGMDDHLHVCQPLRSAASTSRLAAAGCWLRAFYSVGAAFYLWNGLHYQLAIWHLCVLSAAACHFACIVGYASGPTVLARACDQQP